VASSSDAVGLLFRAANATESEESEEAENHDTSDIGPQHSATGIEMASPCLSTDDPVSADVMALWTQHRFVRQGWFTAREAAAYVHA
jgi:hypothetical protein